MQRRRRFTASCKRDAMRSRRSEQRTAARVPRIAFGAVLLATADAQELFQPTGAQGGGRRAMVGATVAERPRKAARKRLVPQARVATVSSSFTEEV